LDSPKRGLYGDNGKQPIDDKELPGFSSLQLLMDRFIIRTQSTSPITPQVCVALSMSLCDVPLKLLFFSCT
jgi:hypothetical protein